MSGKSSTSDMEKVVYHQDWLLKKEGFNNWVSYWVVLRGRWLLMYESGSAESCGHLRKTIELSAGASCAFIARKKRRFPFSLSNAGGTYCFKTETELQRYHWIISVLLSSTGKEKKNLPSSVPNSMKEKAVFPSWNDRHAYKFIDSSKYQRANPTALSNKRRQKYNERRDNRNRTKSECRMLCDKQYASSERYQDRHLRVRSATDQSHRQPTSLISKGENVKELSNTLSARSKSTSDLRCNPGFENDDFDNEESLSHSRSARSRKAAHNVPSVNIVDLEENENVPTCVVTLNGDELLPNMVIEDEKSVDLINLSTPRHSRSPSLNENYKHTEQRLHPESSVPKPIKVKETLSIKSGKVDGGSHTRPTSPYLAPKRVGLGSNSGILFASSSNATLGEPRNAILSPRFSRHINTSDA